MEWLCGLESPGLEAGQRWPPGWMMASAAQGETLHIPASPSGLPIPRPMGGFRTWTPFRSGWDGVAPCEGACVGNCTPGRDPFSSSLPNRAAWWEEGSEGSSGLRGCPKLCAQIKSPSLMTRDGHCSQATWGEEALPQSLPAVGSVSLNPRGSPPSPLPHCPRTPARPGLGRLGTCWSRLLMVWRGTRDAGGVLSQPRLSSGVLLDLEDGWVGFHDGHDNPVNVVL